VLALILWWIPALAQGGPAADPEVGNPEYDRWSSFKPGSWVTFEQPCGKGALMQESYKLLERTSEKATFQCTKVENGFKYPLFQQSIPRKLAVRDPQGAAAQKPDGGEIELQGPGGKQKSIWRKDSEGDEEIEVAGKKLKCHWIKMDYRTDSRLEWVKDMSSTKTWYSKEIPGQVAKMEMSRWIKDDPPYLLVVNRVAKEWRVE
jgi:hypothetical protein